MTNSTGWVERSVVRDLLVHSASPARFYYENAHADPSTEPATVPLGLASFAGDVKSIRRFVGRDHKNVVS